MYGVIGTAILVGAISLLIIKRSQFKSTDGDKMHMIPKKYNHGLVIGGLLFGLGWAFTGACPGPIYALVGSGATVFIMVLLSAVLGVYVYGLVRKWLPH